MDQEDLGNWELLQNCVNGINHFLDRLTREDNDWKIMPRSRDFPFNGIELLTTYKAAIIDAMVSAIIDERRRNIESEEEGPVEIHMESWDQVQTLISNLGDMASRLSSDEDKKLVTICRSQIYDYLIHSLNTTKTRTKHIHGH